MRSVVTEKNIVIRIKKNALLFLMTKITILIHSHMHNKMTMRV